MVQEAQVMEALKEVYDPELGLNVVDLGLIYGIDIDGPSVHVKMTLTTQGCPMHSAMVSWVKEAIAGLEGVQDVNVELVWNPPWTPDRLSDAAREQLGL